MNLKKRLQQQAEKDAEVLLDEDDELFIQQLVENDDSSVVVRPQFKKSKKFWTVLASTLTVVIASIIIFPSVFANRGSDVYYKNADIKETVCQYDEMMSDIKYFQIVEKGQTPYSIVLSYDSVSNDKLYYSLEGSGPISRFSFKILINDKYNLEFEISKNLREKQFSDYILNYEQVEVSDISATSVGYKGIIKSQTEIIYIDYQQIIDIGEQAFFDEIESIIKVKN